MKAEFTHFDSNGNAIMVDVSEKEVTKRVAIAKGSIMVNEEIMKAVKGGTVKKGDVLLTYDLEDMQRASEENALRAQAEKYGIDATVANIQKEQSDYSKAVKGYDDAMAFVVHWSACLESATRDYNEAMYIVNKYNYDMEIVKVHTLEDAINYLKG